MTTEQDVMLAVEHVDECCRKLRLIFEDGPDALDLLEPVDQSVREALVTVAMAYLIEHEENEEVAITQDWLESLPGGEVHKRSGLVSFENSRVRVNIWKHDAGFIASLPPLFSIPIKCRRDVTALLAGLQLQ